MDALRQLSEVDRAALLMRVQEECRMKKSRRR